MLRYTILRNNSESGPFSREELQCFGLLPTDLVWLEGESRSWQHASEFPELSGLISPGIRKVLPENPPATLTTLASSSRHQYTLTETLPQPSDEDAGEFHFQSGGRTSRRNDFVLFSRLFGATAFLLVVAFVYFVGKGLIVRSQASGEQASTAVEIKADTLAPSSTQHAAFAVAGATSTQPLIVATDSVVNTPVTLKKQRPITPPKAALRTPDTAASTTPDAGEPVTQPEPEAEQKPKPAPVNAVAALQVSANEYKVGMFGGIDDLQLSISNSSTAKIEKALLEVDYLKPNGNVVKTQTVSVENISGGSTKTVSVPASSRGVKVRYRVVSATAEGN